MISFIDSEGKERFLGNIPGPVRFNWPVYGDKVDCPMIPRSKWDSITPNEVDFEDAFYLPPVHDQDGIGMCNASATVAGAESCHLSTGGGQSPISLSGGYLYHLICGGSDRGSLLEDGIREAMNGLATVQAQPYLQWQNLTPQARESASKLKVLEAFLCPTFEHCFSAVAYGFKLVSGIMWASNFNPDQNGWLPRPRGSSGGHAIFGYRPAKRGREFGILHQNSWTRSWGRNGRFVIPEWAYSGPVGGWWAIRSITFQDDKSVPPMKE